MTQRHVVVWIDHQEAKIFHVTKDSFEASFVKAAHHHERKHPKTTAEHAHPADADHFFHEVAQALASAEEILVVGPAKAKLELIKHIHRHDHALVPKIAGVETVDHPTDGQLAAYARAYFLKTDQMR